MIWTFLPDFQECWQIHWFNIEIARVQGMELMRQSRYESERQQHKQPSTITRNFPQGCFVQATHTDWVLKFLTRRLNQNRLQQMSKMPRRQLPSNDMMPFWIAWKLWEQAQRKKKPPTVINSAVLRYFHIPLWTSSIMNFKWMLTVKIVDRIRTPCNKLL